MIHRPYDQIKYILDPSPIGVSNFINLHLNKDGRHQPRQSNIDKGKPSQHPLLSYATSSVFYFLLELAGGHMNGLMDLRGTAKERLPCISLSLRNHMPNLMHVHSYILHIF